MNRIGSLVLVIHGTDDEVIDLSHGIAIHDKCQKAVDPLWVEGAGHNDIEIYAQYVERLKRFINEEIKNHQYSIILSMNNAQPQPQQQQPTQAQQTLVTTNAPGTPTSVTTVQPQLTQTSTTMNVSSTLSSTVSTPSSGSSSSSTSPTLPPKSDQNAPPAKTSE